MMCMNSKMMMDADTKREWQQWPNGGAKFCKWKRVLWNASLCCNRNSNCWDREIVRVRKAGVDVRRLRR